MYVCICISNAVTQRQLEASARSGVRSPEELATELGVGAGCGCRRDCATEMLREAYNALRPEPIVKHSA